MLGVSQLFLLSGTPGAATRTCYCHHNKLSSAHTGCLPTAFAIQGTGKLAIRIAYVQNRTYPVTEMGTYSLFAPDPVITTVDNRRTYVFMCLSFSEF